MITADFLNGEDGIVTGFSIRGHSDYSGHGSDIVCAAVSSAAFMAVNTLTDVLNITPLALRADDGDMLFRIELRDERRSRDILSGLRIHLKNLEEQYPKNIRVSYIEI